MGLPHFVPTFMVLDKSCMYSRVRHTLYSCLQYKCSPIHWPTPLRKEGQIALDGVCHLWYCGYPNSSPKGISTTTKAIMHCLGLFPHLCVCTCTPDLYDQKWVPKKRTRDYQRLLSRNPGKCRWLLRIQVKEGSLWSRSGRLPRPLNPLCCFSCSSYCSSCTSYILSLYPCSCIPPPPIKNAYPPLLVSLHHCKSI